MLDTAKDFRYSVFMQISGQYFTDEILARIRSRVRDESALTRSGLSREVCDWMDWRDTGGRPKEMSCRVALLKLSRRGLIELPEPKAVSFAKPIDAPVIATDWLTIKTTLAELGRVWLEPVDSNNIESSKQWWEMMRAHHPQGAAPLCGAQLRYSVCCEAGVLGGLSFSAAAWRLKPRDRWIGWDDATRQKMLPRVVNNSRFLILPGVRVANLASHVLSLALSRLATDWQTRYGITPLLVETFVDGSSYRGTCYKAANWIHLGQSQGRGRQNSGHLQSKTIKEIWGYPLHAQCQSLLQMNDEPIRLSATLAMARCLTPLDWVEEEFGGCKLPDARLQSRLHSLARDFYARPTANITQACASRAKAKAAYRFLDHEMTTMDTLLQPHYRATEARVKLESTVLAVQDTTSLNYTAHAATEGMGSIGSTVNGPQGLHLHSTLAFSTQGTPLGFLDAQCWARKPEDFGKKAKRHTTPIEEKESFKWLKSFRAVADVQTRCPHTTLVSVGDREADIYELFVEAFKSDNGPKLLVRAKNNRTLQDEQARLWETMLARPVDGIQVLEVPRQGSRAARQARMQIRYAAVNLAPGKKYGGDPISVWAVLAQEQEVPEGVIPLEWMLLTTMPVASFAQATEKLMWYARRWGIEVLHRTLKSGCRIEQRQLGNADRIEACLAIDMVVAWRIYYLNKLGREVPESPCTVYFEEAEWKALMVFTNKNPIPPDNPPSLREATRRVAGLGGFLGRKCDGEPGTQTLWLGLQRLDDIVAMWRVMAYATQVTVSSGTGYG
jgi:hypothetical protein